MPEQLSLITVVLIAVVLVVALLVLWKVYRSTVGRQDQSGTTAPATDTAHTDRPDHAAPPADSDPAPSAEAPVALSANERFKQRLHATRQTLAGFGELFRGGATDAEYELLEELLISVDVGVNASTEIVAQLKTEARRDGTTDPAELRERLKQLIRAQLIVPERLGRRVDGPSVWLVAGVNGAGKTTTIGKLAAQIIQAGETVVLGAADTFRAAATEQLAVWAERTGAELIAKDPGADPGAVAYETFAAAQRIAADVAIVDTAGRLQNHRELMDELGKVKRVLEKQAGDLDEVLLVIDATTGQNGIAQARAFTDIVNVTGIVLTKLDGSSKGGIVVAVQRELGIPVKLVGLGEDIADLAVFDPDLFVEGLFAGA